MKLRARIIDYFLGRHPSPVEYAFRARLLVNFILVTMIFAMLFFLDTFITKFTVARYMMFGAVICFLGQLFALRSGASRWWIAQIFIATCWAIVMVLVLFSGGLKSATLPWITLIPVMALLLLGRKVGITWGVAGVASLLFVGLAGSPISIPDAWMAPESEHRILSLHLGLLAIGLSLTYIFHSQGAGLLQTIGDQKAIIEKHNSEIEARNESLETEVDKRTRELVDYNRQLEQFAFIASHNLRAPVATLLGLGHLLEVSTGNKDEVDQICSNMITTSRELDRVVRDLSTILEIRNSTQAILSEINLEEEVRLVCVNMDRELKEAGALLETDFSSVPLIRAVRPLVDSILMNLISNAVKYRRPDRAPRIAVRSFRSDGEVCLAISDNGMGMDLEVHGDKLFTLYGRFHSHVDGKGLGLYLVKTHVTAMGGRVEVESTPGLGTTFRVFLKDLGHI